MSTFVSNNDQNQVAEANKAPFKLKAIDDATKSAIENAVQACHMSARFDDSGGKNVPVDSSDMSSIFIDKNGKIENASSDHILTIQEPADKPADALEHDVNNDKSDENTLVGELSGGEAGLAATSIDGAGQPSLKPPVEKDVAQLRGESGNKSITNASASVSKKSTDKATEDNGAHNNTGIKTCARPGGARHTVGGKGLLKHNRADHNHAGMKTCARPDGSRYTIGGKGPSKPAFSNIEDAEKFDDDPIDEVYNHQWHGGKGPVKTMLPHIENAEDADEDVEMSEQDAESSEEDSDIFDENPGMFEEDDDVTEDVEDNIVGSSPTRRDMGIKSCVKPDGTRYTVGGKGLAKAPDSNNDISKSSKEDSEDKVVRNFPTRSATGINSCTTVGNKGPSQTTPSIIEIAEVSGEGIDESDVDLDSEEGERQDLVKAVREDVEQKLAAITDLNQQLAAQRNVILKKRLQEKLNSLEKEIQLKLASIEDSETTGAESVDEALQNSGDAPITKNISNTDAASGDKSMAS